MGDFFPSGVFNSQVNPVFFFSEKSFDLFPEVKTPYEAYEFP